LWEGSIPADKVFARSSLAFMVVEKEGLSMWVERKKKEEKRIQREPKAISACLPQLGWTSIFHHAQPVLSPHSINNGRSRKLSPFILTSPHIN